MKNFLLRLFLALFLLSLLTVGAFPQNPPKAQFGYIVLPFKNNTDFQGRWVLGADIPRYLSAYMTAKYGVLVVSPVVVLNYLHQENLPDDAIEDVKFWNDLYRKFGYRYLVAGNVDAFDVSRFTTSTPEIGGYEAFKGEVSVSYDIYDLESTSTSASAVRFSKGEVHGEFADRSLALTLLGKPTERTIEYRDLDRVPFGSEDFNRTVIGQACLRMADDFTVDLETKFPVLRSKEFLSGALTALGTEITDSSDIVFKGRIVTGSVVFIEGENTFVNIGSEDGVRKGQFVSVYPQARKEKDTSDVKIGKGMDRKIGELEIEEIRGPHLSLARIKDGKGEIKQKDRIRIRVLE